METSGFYKLDEGNLLYGPNFVLNENYELYKNTHEFYVYPIDGWYWFDNEDSARSFFNLPPLEDQPEIPGMPLEF